ncbi:MAG: SRPBCC family protein [Pseudomonas sp.]|uniref:SRPBCC family protein n=1 Tax=Pseudomonas sp. TaxID=306 RepID=UPI003BB4D07D
MNSYQPPLNQVAFSVIDLRLTDQWFREGLGFLPAGGSRIMASLPLTARVQGVPGAATTMWWLVGGNAGFQLELFQYRRPIAKLMPADFRPCDIGYTRIGVSVRDFDATLARLAALGTKPLAPAQGNPGERRVCVRNPDGVYVEIIECHALPQSPDAEQTSCSASLHSVTVSTADLASSVAYFAAVCGKEPEEFRLHTAEHESLWGLDGALADSAVFKAGDVWLEVVQYRTPIGKPWPKDYRICDQGILNIAFGADNKRDFLQVYERTSAFGAMPNCAPVHLPFKPKAGVVYVNDRLGFSVELVWMAPGKDKLEWGWHPLPINARPDTDNQRAVAKVRIDAPLDKVWAVLNDQERMSKWIGFDQVRVVRAGSIVRDGVGAERHMTGSVGQVVEQITEVIPQQSIRYRVIEGSPFVDHQGHILVASEGGQTEVTWTIRFRAKVPFAGAPLRFALQRMLGKMLGHGLKPYAERIEA